MLAGLDDIEWHAIDHAYGPADDVPGLLRALTQGHRDLRAEALHELFGNIHHQGTLHAATPVALPFLLELAEHQAVDDRDRVLDLLAAIADGHADDDEEDHAGAALQILARERGRLVALLDDRLPAVGFSAALVLSKLGAHGEELAPRLETAARAAAGVRRAGLVAIVGKLGHASSAGFLQEEAASRNRVVRFAAELAQVLLLGEDAPSAAIDAVKRLQADEELLEQLLAGLPWDLYAELAPPVLFERAGLSAE